MNTKEFKRRGTLVRPGCQVMKLYPDKVTGKPKFPWQRKKRRAAHEQRNTLEHLRRVGRVSMVQIGEDEFRTPNRAERRSAGFRSRTKEALVALHYGTRTRPEPIVRLEPSAQLELAREASALVRARLYTRRQKGQRRTKRERTRHSIEVRTVADVYRLIDRARGLGETRYFPRY